MRRRAQALGAALQWQSVPGQGARVSLRLPVQRTSAG
jgi:signal transduction histidine kinase